MDPVTPFDWHRMFLGEEPPLYFLEIAFRVVAIYLFAALLLRLMGKRGLRQLSPFEFVVVIALGSATGDAMFYPEVPILYAWVVIAMVVLLDRLFAHAQLRWRKVNTFLEGEPRPLVWEGRVLESNLHAEGLRRDEFLSLLREEGIERTDEVRFAFLERSGRIGWIRGEEGAVGTEASTFPTEMSGDPRAGQE
ncbi:MAG TPA: DUF421 domain-containing protein [Bacteroidetes bacterium]|nr:DUF421 domain-containing protein [Bacteroidota bacterium]HIL58665.1 DUF421 domain-containing protein [Rhodothermales bacterium]